VALPGVHGLEGNAGAPDPTPASPGTLPGPQPARPARRVDQLDSPAHGGYNRAPSHP
jgi:hypothetical protein